ncbi:hypothetical protein K1719_030793 [Acacia pycnantha]|nr:hypothetical protein K1719_030793 [Acacia pycnantha]
MQNGTDAVGALPPRVYVGHSVYKGKAALTVTPRPPEFASLEGAVNFALMLSQMDGGCPVDYNTITDLFLQEYDGNEVMKNIIYGPGGRKYKFGKG